MKKRMSIVLVLVLICSMLTGLYANAEGTYTQSPLLAPKVESGELPPVTERLPNEPKLVHEALDEHVELEIGTYGGTYKHAAYTTNSNGNTMMGLREGLLSMSSLDSDEIIGNVIKDYSINDDSTVFTFYLREGLKWSDGEPVTVADFMFTYNDVIMNEELTPVISTTMRAGGKSDGAPMVVEVVDDWTIQVSFESSYGGFIVYTSIRSWAGYTEMLKPAHYLKKFHKSYAEECHGSLEAYYEFMQPFATAMGYDDVTAEGVWTYVFNQIDVTTSELSNPTHALTTVVFSSLVEKNFPVLYPFVMTSANERITYYERNPYYFKVDAANQQLPYFDYLESYYYETAELIIIEQLAGNMTVEETAFSNYTVLKEGEESGGYTATIRDGHSSITTIMLNATYGLNVDGTVKDDVDSQAWQEVIGDVRFRQAVTYALDAEEMNEVLYIGLAKVNDYYDCENDIDAANALLDEMGMLDIDGDGYRETPSGKRFAVQIWNNNYFPDYVMATELCIEYWRGIGLNIDGYTTDATLFWPSVNTNEVPMVFGEVHGAELWHAVDWGMQYWAPLWNAWYGAGGMTGALEGSSEYLEPDDRVKELLSTIETIMVVDPMTAVGEVIPDIQTMLAEDMYIIFPLCDRPTVQVVDIDLANVPEGLQVNLLSSVEFVYLTNFSYED